MINEDYCSYEVAKLLKEKGFNERCLYYYFSEGIKMHKSQGFRHKNSPSVSTYSAPTHQMAMAWLREEKKLFVEVRINYEDGAYPMYDAFVHNVATCEQYSVLGYDRYSYNDAVGAALKYCLTNIV